MSLIRGEKIRLVQPNGPDITLVVFGDEFYARYKEKQNDPVSEGEVFPNGETQLVQRNRNPFIGHPESVARSMKYAGVFAVLNKSRMVYLVVGAACCLEAVSNISKE